jgi:hypothetical protein
MLGMTKEKIGIKKPPWFLGTKVGWNNDVKAVRRRVTSFLE